MLFTRIIFLKTIDNQRTKSSLGKYEDIARIRIRQIQSHMDDIVAKYLERSLAKCEQKSLPETIIKIILYYLSKNQVRNSENIAEAVEQHFIWFDKYIKLNYDLEKRLSIYCELSYLLNQEEYFKYPLYKKIAQDAVYKIYEKEKDLWLRKRSAELFMREEPI